MTKQSLISKILYSLKRFFLDILGDIKVYYWPLFLIYCPTTYKVKGTQTRQAMKLIRPGDIVQRKYCHYLDGFFISGRYSHTGVYIGNGKVIHAISEGISEIDLIDFMRCDAFCILRPASGQKEAIVRAKGYLGTPYDFNFTDDDSRIYCHELAAHCYVELNIEKKQPTLFGFTWGHPKTYLAESFLNNDNFTKIYEYYSLKETNY